MTGKMTYGGLALLTAALLLWGGALYFAWNIQEDEQGRATERADREVQGAKAAIAVRTHALVLDTEDERVLIDRMLNVELLSVADMIEDVGKNTGTGLRVRSASPQNVSEGAPLIEVKFVVEGMGKFSSLMQALRLLETLPIPSTIDGIDIDKSESSGPGDSWRISVSIRVFSNPAVSS